MLSREAAMAQTHNLPKVSTLIITSQMQFLIFGHFIIFIITCHLKSRHIPESSIGLFDRCLTPLSTIFQLYRGTVLLVGETGVPGENHYPVASH
jgi:hypothetical protein